MFMAEPDDSDDPFVVHLRPLVHIEVDADGGAEAQLKAQRELLDAIDDAIDVHEIELDDLSIDNASVLEEMLDGNVDETEMGMPPEDTDLDVDEDEMTDLSSVLTGEDDVDTEDDDDT